MDWDDDFDDELKVGSSGNSSIQDKGSSEGGLDPMDVTNPASAYFFLSDDAQDEISGKDLK
jgi:hypothetical protein